MKRASALISIFAFASSLFLASCGNNSKPPTSEKDVPDSALTDSLPSSGENEFQQDVAPQGRTNQIDSLKDSVQRKP